MHDDADSRASTYSLGLSICTFRTPSRSSWCHAAHGTGHARQRSEPWPTLAEALGVWISRAQLRVRRAKCARLRGMEDKARTPCVACGAHGCRLPLFPRNSQFETSRHPVLLLASRHTRHKIDGRGLAREDSKRSELRGSLASFAEMNRKPTQRLEDETELPHST